MYKVYCDAWLHFGREAQHNTPGRDRTICVWCPELIAGLPGNRAAFLILGIGSVGQFVCSPDGGLSIINAVLNLPHSLSLQIPRRIRELSAVIRCPDGIGQPE